jgi:YidC/Oxa1 family membrane protein insertase
VQIPVFFSLYKVLFVTIEMRHTPFYGWISDLSAPDPLGILTLFGLIDWQVPAALAVVNLGIWPLLMGGTMMLQQRLNPPPPDPMQAKMMMLLPFFFMFILAGFPAGLVIYWTWNNLLSIAQQYVIMRRVRREAEAKTTHIDLAALAAQEPVDDNPKPDVAESISTPPKKKKGKRKRRR